MYAMEKIQLIYGLLDLDNLVNQGRRYYEYQMNNH